MAVKGFRKFGGAVLAAALAFQTSAAGAVCITDPEAKSVALFFAPDLLRALSTTCRASLPANAYLTRSSDALAARYRTASTAAWPGVQALIGRIPETKIFRGLNEEGARGMIAAMVEDKGLGKISPKDCALFNEMLAPLDPLPPENMASFLVALGKLGESASAKPRADKQAAKPSIFCPAVK